MISLLLFGLLLLQSCLYCSSDNENAGTTTEKPTSFWKRFFDFFNFICTLNQTWSTIRNFFGIAL
uniref:MEG-10.2 protein n=1 Tax=Schistosoma mansoni TaxID=6183 RepID=A0A0U5KJN7_SCHMA|nr:TPA: MEG-10.2 protein [Schistosoma mansoni]